MDTFMKQYSLLSRDAQREFDQKWGAEPWKAPGKNLPHLRKAWKRALDPLPVYPRWEQNPLSDSPLWMALRAKNRRAASTLLDQAPTLTREEAGRCALLTLGWAPELLDRILALAPDRPYLWLRHEVTLPGTPRLQLRLCGSLVMIAAALDDLAALNILLRRGAPADYDFLRDRWAIVGDLLMGGITMGALRSPAYSLQQIRSGTPAPDGSSHVLLNADPLSAAIFCNAKRCALRLLELPEVTVTPAVRRALAVTPENETQALVGQRLGVPLEALLQPDDFGPEPDHHLFLPVLQRNPRISREHVLALLKGLDGTPPETALPLFSLIDPELLGDAVWEVWHSNRWGSDVLTLADRLSLPLDRCRVPEDESRTGLLAALNHFRITGTPPQGGLSGLAACLLSQLADRFSTRHLSADQLLRLPGAARILEEEDPAMVLAFLERNSEIPQERVLPLLKLLNITKEVSYVL